MIIFIIFIAVWLALNFVKFPILISLLGVALFIYFLKKIKLKKSLIFFASFIIISTLSFYINKPLPSIDENFGIVILSKENYFIYWSKFTKYYVYNENNQLQIGDILSLNGDIQNNNFAFLESSLNFNEYLKNKGVFYQINNPKFEIIFSNPIKLNEIKNDFLNGFSPENRNFIDSLFFANSHYDDQFISLLSSMHLYRLMSASGLIIYSLLNGIIYFLKLKINEKYAKIVALIILSFYLIFTLFKFSILRLTILFVLRWINQYILKNKFSYITILSFSGLLFLVFDPFLAYQDGFTLGYLMSLLIYFTRNSFSFLKSFKKKMLLTVVIFLFFIPFESQYYHEISLFSFIITPLLTPLIILISSFCLISFYGIRLTNIIENLTNFLKTIVNFINPLMINIYCPEMNIYLSIIFEGILILLLYIFSIRFKPFYKLSFIYLTLLVLYFIPLNNFIYDEISFINVGQGDSTYIRYNNQHILIDTGGSLYNDIAKECLIPFFKKRRVYHLDYVITTHNDFDHVGALDSLINNFNVENYINSDENFPLQIDDLTIYNLNNTISLQDDENDRSLVLYFSLNETKIMLMGDASTKIENNIMNEYSNLSCDILKIGHHGSKTSTSEDFISFLNPKKAIISCGLNNYYGHPDPYVISVLKRYNVDILRTDLMNTISFYFH